MEKIKSIAFSLSLNGNGIVNYDSNDQRFFLYNNCGYPMMKENVRLSKKAFMKKKEPIVITNSKGEERINDTDAFIKISSECLRHSVFENDTEVMNPKCLMSDYVTAFYLSSVHSLLRGFTVLDKSDVDLVKKSCLTITSAIDKDAKPYIEVNSNAAPKEKTSEEKGSTSLFFTENVGETNYNSRGFISLKELEFVSCDQFLGRMGFDPKWLEGEKPLLNEMFIKHYGSIPFTPGYFSTSTLTLSNKIGEFGVKFEKKFVFFLVKELLKRLLSINIKRAGAFAATSSLKIKFIGNNCLNSNLSNEEGWINVDEEFINNLEKFFEENNMDIFDFYNELSEEEISQTRGEINKIEKEREEAAKKEKAEKKAKKNSKKNNSEKEGE